MSISTSNNTLKTTLLAIATLVIVSTLGATPAFAKACKHVHIEVKNQTGAKVKIVDLDYWDTESEKWRSKSVRNEQINHNRTWQKRFNLGRVNGQDVKIRIEYRKQKWNRVFKKWMYSGKLYKTISAEKRCTKNAEFMMTL